jgi:hypothetical protein
LFPGPTCPGTPGAAKCPEPLCTGKVLPLPSWCLAPCQWILLHLHCSYGLMRQSSPLLVPRWSPQHQVCAGCGQPLLGGGPSRRCSAHLSLRAWSSTPAALEVHVPVSSPKTAAFPPFGPGRRSTMPMQRLQHGALFEAAVIPSCSGPQVCSPPRSLLPRRFPPSGSRGFSIRASRGSLPPHAPDMLTV